MAPHRNASAFAVLALGVLFAVPLAEVVVRVAGLAPEIRVIDLTHDHTIYQRSTNPILAFEIKPNWRDPDADSRRSYRFTNAHGQRDVERELVKAPGTERILLLGASVVEGVGIDDLEQTIGRRLEQQLADGTEVLNFGVSAYCTRAKVELLRVKGLGFDPDVVVLFVSQNDFNNFNFEAFELGPASSRPAFVDALYEHSHAFRALAVRTNRWGFRAQNDPAAWSREAIGENNVVDGFALFAALAAEHGFDPIVAIWPRFTDEAVEDTDPMPGRPGRLLFEAVAAMYGIPAFRFSTYFERDRARHRGESPRVRYTVGDRLHPNPFGADLAAAALGSELPLARGAFVPGTGPLDDEVVRAAARRSDRDPTDSRRLVNVGNSLLEEDRVAEAIENYREAIRAQPNLSEAHHNLGIALRKSGRLPEALAAFEVAGRLSPELPEVHFNVGVTLQRMGRPADAVPAFRRALELRPDFEAAGRELAASEAAAG